VSRLGHGVQPTQSLSSFKARRVQYAALRPGRLYLAAGRAHRRIRWRASYRALRSCWSDMCPGLSVVPEGSNHWATHACVVHHVEQRQASQGRGEASRAMSKKCKHTCASADFTVCRWIPQVLPRMKW